MPRRPAPLDPADGPQARFALALRRLRDKAGFEAKTINAIAAETNIAKSTLYAAMRGTRMPTVPVLAALVRAWNGDPEEWLVRRTETEQEIERLRTHSAERGQPRPELDRAMKALGAGLAALGSAPKVFEPRVAAQAPSAAPLAEAGPTDVEIKEEFLRRLTEPDGDVVDLWDELRKHAGHPTVRMVASASRVTFSTASNVLRGLDRSPRNVERVLTTLLARWENIDTRAQAPSEA
ncbi:helix-turn-helix domain-containing protein [Streptomyces collinus]|uniref:helix-turn-helix domain-containing protein n=1 Tax=Streptomyces collinus TaxID=42684 RepID=UPI0036B63484